MAEFCSWCEKKNYDLHLPSIAWLLKRGEVENFFCEGCDLRGVYKKPDGSLLIAREKKGTIIWTKTSYRTLKFKFTQGLTPQAI